MTPFLVRIVFGVSYGLSRSFGLILDICAARYFFGQHVSVSILIFCFIVTNDILICSWSVTRSLYYLLPAGTLVFWNKEFCVSMIFLRDVIALSSIYFTTIMSLARTHQLLHPFAHISLHKIAVSLTVAASLSLSIAMLRLTKSTINYITDRATCSLFSKSDWRMVILGSYNISYTLPVLCVVVSCVLSTISLLKTHTTQNNAPGWAVKRRASVTIVVLTLVFLLYNIPVVAMIRIYVDGTNVPDYMTELLLSVTMALNSMSNAVVYIARMTKLRSEVFNIKLKTMHLNTS